jgi:uncharacterized membrane protein
MENRPAKSLIGAQAVNSRSTEKEAAMWVMLTGLVLFLGVHSVRIVADDWRSAFIAKRGAGAFKGLYTVASLLGFGLMVWGFGLARQDPVVLWTPPVWARHAAGALMLPSFVLLFSAYVPRNQIKARLHHPMILSVKVWALAHLLANGKLADVVLFGAFLVWAVLDFRSSRQRDRVGNVLYPAGNAAGTAAALAVGAAAWAGFAFWAHGALIGVRPFG